LLGIFGGGGGGEGTFSGNGGREEEGPEERKSPPTLQRPGAKKSAHFNEKLVRERQCSFKSHTVILELYLPICIVHTYTNDMRAYVHMYIYLSIYV